jgi:hypothetical protein
MMCGGIPCVKDVYLLFSGSNGHCAEQATGIEKTITVNREEKMLYENYSENFEKPPAGNRPKSAGATRQLSGGKSAKKTVASPHGSERY